MCDGKAALEKHGDIISLYTCLGLIRSPLPASILMRVSLCHAEFTALAALSGDPAMCNCLTQERPLHALAALWQADKVLSWPVKMCFLPECDCMAFCLHGVH